MAFLRKSKQKVQRALLENLPRKIVPTVEFALDTSQEDEHYVDSLLAGQR